ncbi:NGFI-A-binding protein homolog [Pieris brassicae]|uniref:NAB co-repressor domain-containing protein n=1 Tax=Pieris brassicae TaxID=7116 RepID=A0A9P0XAI4_PIEBR|nr:NGFI-A-binding protein homolog [Pieris brassicae]CAH4027373.1 unnamed protein product [Pieris brassicae]
MCASEKGDMESPGEETGRASHPAPQPNGSNKIIGRNVNGTMVVTSAPSNEAELQLYRVMQRASLLAYYDTLLEMGGDDVQQLCDAGEEEFLEIMALVGMASKPLHVRRLQKALQEWVNNPALFQIPIVPNICPTENPFIQCNQRLLNIPSIPNLPRTVASPDNNRPMYSPSPGAPENSCGSTASAPNASPVHSQTNTFTKIVLPSSPVAPTTRSFSPQNNPPASSSSPGSGTSPLLTPVLLDVHVHKLATAADKLSKHLPQLEPKPQNTKKKMCKDLELVMMMPESDPRRMEEIRKYAAIYGRFDCKRKPEKPLTLHEVMVNEAAAQMCRCVPALLTRRDELFPLARQLVRRAGLHYSKHGLPPTPAEDRERDEEETPSKRPRQEGEDGVRASPDARNSNHTWWGMKTESDDADSRCSYSSTSTPPPETEESRPQVVAARGDSIIAVANPALQPLPPPHPARNHSN